MHGAGVEDEVVSCPWIAAEKFGRQQITLQSVTPRTGRDDVAGHVGPAVRERVYVIQRGEIEVKWRGAIHAPASAVAHRGALDRALLMAGTDLFGAPRHARRSRKGNAVELPTSGQCHLAKKATPRDGSDSRGGVSRRS